jgi:hypothetical protein
MASDWYSVTERAPWSPFRHQIFYAYAPPIIERVRCRSGDTVDIVGLTSMRSLPLGQMATSLRENPLLFVRDSAVHVPSRAMTRSLGSYVDRQVDALGGAEIDE